MQQTRTNNEAQSEQATEVNADNPVIEVKNLTTSFTLDEGELKAVDGVNFSINQGEVVGVLGESGCGKSVTGRSIMSLIQNPGHSEGSIYWHRPDGSSVDLLHLKASGRTMRSIRGGEISMIFQEPMTSLSPIHTVRNQILEAIRLHDSEISKKEAEERAVETLRMVGIPDAPTTMGKYPHQLSGGLRQRSMIAIALSTSPSLLIADEPTTALDVTVQAQILQLLKSFQDRMSLSVLYITHSLPVIAEMSERVIVMYLGRIVETGKMAEVFENPMHPYTQGLMRAIPRLDQESGERLETIKGVVPTPLEMPPQCGFCSRCPQVMSGTCDTRIPELREVETNHFVRCFLYE